MSESERVGRLELAPARVNVERRRVGAGEELVLRSPLELGELPRCLGEYLRRWAQATPAAIFLAERGADGGWERVSYGEARSQVLALGQALLERGLGPGAPLVILSGNSVAHALLALAAMDVGVPVAPVSAAYTLLSQDLSKLRTIQALLQPGLVYAEDGQAYARGLKLFVAGGARPVIKSNPPDRLGACEPLEALLAVSPGEEQRRASAAVELDSVAKLLFTSGSTGEPKAVINTQRMLVSNQEAIAQLWPFVARRPPVLVDWLPWSHTFGGNHNFNLVLRNGGALYLDGGKPVPGAVELTVQNLRELSPTLYFNVPRGFEALLPYLQRESALRRRFFAELDLVFYAGASLPEHLWRALEELSLGELGRKVFMVSAWGSTETAPMATTVHFPVEGPGVIGLPAPGTEIKLTPVAQESGADGGKLELRVRGPNVTPGYWLREDLTRAAFDEEGFYRIGDAGRLRDPERPERGLVFDGRVAENFKLNSGTWVHTGALRLAAIAAGAPVIQDAVLTGHDREDLGLLVVPSLAGCRAVCPDGELLELAELLEREEVRRTLVKGLAAHNRRQPASSTRIARVMVLLEPPQLDAGEITDKGYINQRAVLERRAALVERLYQAPAPAGEAPVLVDDSARRPLPG